jgi:proteinaceous RNase P
MIISSILIDLEGELIQEWLQQHGPFEAVVDGANVSLINQRSFSFFQVSEMLRISFMPLLSFESFKAKSMNWVLIDFFWL